MNNKSKWEKLFILLTICVAIFAILAFSGCNGKSCENCKCESQDVEGGSVSGISVPGCGGCLTSGCGCNTCFWPQSCKCTCADWEGVETSEQVFTGEGYIKGCDTRYYSGDGCLGCGCNQKEKMMYYGCAKAGEEDKDVRGCFVGQTGVGEARIGCNGCRGCKDNDYSAGELLEAAEVLGGIE